MRVLLTGSSGWLGRFLAPRLREEGHEVTGLDVAPGTDTDVLGTVAEGRPLPFVHDPHYVSPKEGAFT